MSVLHSLCACVVALAVSNAPASGETPRSEAKPAPREPVAISKPPGNTKSFTEVKSAPADPSIAANSRGVSGSAAWDSSLEPTAKEHFAAGRFKEALEAYTLWRCSHFCGNGYFSNRGERWYKIALCHAHLKDHEAAAQTCLDALREGNWDDLGTCKLLFLLYREAGQLNDLTQWLDAIEDVVIRKQPKAWLLPPADRAKLVKHLSTGDVRELMAAPQADAPKWPADVPLPKAGTLPKAPAK